MKSVFSAVSCDLLNRSRSVVYFNSLKIKPGYPYLFECCLENTIGITKNMIII